MSTMQPGMLPPGPVKKTSPLVWILVAIAGLMVLFGIAIFAGGLFIAHKVNQVASGNPGLTAAKMIAMANPDVEVLSSDDSRGTITLKDKKTGKIMTLNFEDIKKGKLTMQEEGHEAVSIQTSGNGSGATLEARSSEGTVKFGAGASRLPDWIPNYPSSAPQGNFGMQGTGEDAGTVMFTTKDPVDKVAKFYEEGLKKSGLTTNSNSMQQNGKTAMATISGEAADKKRTAAVTAVPGDEGVTVTVTYSAKK
ncbi:MAG TPA: hypothetical protein VMZ52_20650 [Bryobacteraceae bacterium]|nr:hypothetical protein [Bryobacteraceae bacterium]